jgi:WD40 repeat protein
LVVTASDGGASLWSVPNTIPASDSVVASKSVAVKAMAEPSAEAKVNEAKTDSAALMEQPPIRHIRDYHGHENTVRDALYLAPCPNSLGNLKPRDSYLLKCQPYLITCGEDGRVIRWSNQGHAAIGTLDLSDRSLVDATWVSKRQIAVTTNAGKRQKPLHFRGGSIQNHELFVDTRRIRLPKSIAKASPVGGIGDQTIDAPRFAVCTTKSIYVFHTGLSDVIAERSLTDERGFRYTAACPVGSRYLLAASQQPTVTATPKPPQSKDDAPPIPNRQTALLLYDLRTDLPPQSLALDNVGSISRLRVSPDGTRVFGCCNDGKMFFVTIPTDEDGVRKWSETQLHSWEAHLRAIRDFVWVSHHERLATVSDDGTCAIWNPPAKLLPTEQSPLDPSPLGETPADAEPLALGQRLYVSSGPVRRITTNSQGDRIATVSDDRVIRVWDTDSGLELISLEPRKENVASIEFSPDDRYLMIAEAKSRIDVIQLID